VGPGREHHYTEFLIPTERRVRRFKEGIELIKALWTESKVTYRGTFFPRVRSSSTSVR
jgi:alkanesulfonate monooxygenase SsuD/methylene tetrahydromethanopterin reductase-like flavin-dependent oxidoreductase (luciferase family)